MKWKSNEMFGVLRRAYSRMIDARQYDYKITARKFGVEEKLLRNFVDSLNNWFASLIGEAVAYLDTKYVVRGVDKFCIIVELEGSHYAVNKADFLEKWKA